MTDKKDCMTMEQAEQKMECLREVFSIVRLVDGEMLEKRAEHSADADADAMEMCQCYSFWNKAKPCENCISMKSLREKNRQRSWNFWIRIFHCILWLKCQQEQIQQWLKSVIHIRILQK